MLAWRMEKNFQMSKENFMELYVDELELYFAPSPRSPRPALSSAKKVNKKPYISVAILKSKKGAWGESKALA